MDPELWMTFYVYYGEPTLQWKEVRRKLKKTNYTLGDLMDDLHKDNEEITKDTPLIDYLVRRFGETKSMW